MGVYNNFLMRVQVDLWVCIISSSNLSLDLPVYLSIDICPSPSNRAPNRLQEVGGLGPQLWGKSPESGGCIICFSPNVGCVEFLTSSHFPGCPTMGCAYLLLSLHIDRYIYNYRRKLRSQTFDNMDR